MALSNQKSPEHFATYTQVQGSFSKGETDPVVKPSAREIKKQLKELRQFIKKEKPSIGAVIGAIIVGLFLAGLVLSAACSLSCNGHDGLAALVAVGGLVAIFFIMKLILKPRRRPQKDAEKDAVKPSNQLG